MDGELWHIVEAKRDDGTPTMFRIRELEPRKQLTRIFVVELPYPSMELSRLPTADAYHRLGELEERWLRPACASLGWEIVGSKTEDGSFFLYMYGAGDPNALVERISPFDAELGFYDDEDPDWLEYATLRELLDQAKAMPPVDALPEVTVPVSMLANAAGMNGTRVAPPKAKSTKTSPIRKLAKKVRAKAPTQVTARTAGTSARSAAKQPTKRPAAKKSAARKSAAKKSAAKKSAAKKSAVMKSAAKKLAAKKSPKPGMTKKSATKTAAAAKAAKQPKRR